MKKYGQPVVIGGMVMDLRGRPKPGKKLQLKTSNPGNLNQTPGGVSRNIAENMLRLGIEPFMISVVGDDHIGNNLLEHSKKIGLPTEGVSILKKKRTSFYLAILEQDGDLHTAIADMDIFDMITPQLVLNHIEAVSQAPMVIMDTNMPIDTLHQIAKLCEENNTPLWVEPVSVAKSKKAIDIMDKITYLSPNIDELASLSGIFIQSHKDIERACRNLIKDGVDHIMVTLGKNGVILANKEQIVRYPAFPAQVVDVTGAGDSFGGGVVYALMKGFSIEKAIPYGLVVAKTTIETDETVASDLNPEFIEEEYRRLIENEEDRQNRQLYDYTT